MTGQPQFSLKQLLLIVAGLAVCTAVARALWGTLSLAALIAAAGLTCTIYGAGQVERKSRAFLPVAICSFGALLILVGLCSGAVLTGIE